MMTVEPTLLPDAAIVLGIASTAMPFARTPEAEAERWLRVLRLHGEVGAVLQALGVSEVPLSAPGEGPDGKRPAARKRDDRDVTTLVTSEAVRIASQRRAGAVSTTDLLIAVMQVYGPDFDRVLRTHGTDRDEVIERLGVSVPEPADG
jgi:hypothetical protein